MYNDEFINFLKEKISISSVVEKKVKILNRSGNKTALCPFHSEKTPSFHINDEKGFYHCFGCGEHGDIISFVMKSEYLSFKEAVEKLANDYGIPLPKTGDRKENQEQLKIIDEIYSINELTATFFQENLYRQDGNNCLSYLHRRGLNDRQIKLFRLGYATNSFNELMNFLKSKNISEEKMLLAGIVAKNDSSKLYDKFRNRAMVPVFDKKGRVMAFTGRVLDKNTMPKYMNSPETPIYHKSNVLFNYFFARKPIIKNNRAIFVEGNFDVISLFINGVENVVAPMGTAATIEQFLELWNITEEIVVCFDGDDAGIKASKRVAEMLLSVVEAKRTLKIVFLPKDVDPDDFIRNFGKNAFMSYIQDKKNCFSLSEFMFNDILKKLNIGEEDEHVTAEQKSNLEFETNATVNKIKNRQLAKNFEYYFKGEMFKLCRKNFRKSIDYKNITKINISKQTSFSSNSSKGIMESIYNLEKKILFLIANNLNLIKELYLVYNIDIFSLQFYIENCDDILKTVFDAYEEFKGEEKYLISNLEKYNFSDYLVLIGDNSVNFLLEKFFYNVEYLYILILEKNILLLNMEAKELTFKNNDDTRRKIIDNELKKLYEERSLLEDKINENL